MKSHAARKALRHARRRARWLVRRPRVRGRVPGMFPGALRLGEAEEDAAAEAAREVVRSRRLFRYYGASGRPLEGSRVKQFERAFAGRVGADQALAVNSGTSALVCGLVALGVGPGDEVIVPAYTWFSTASSVMAVGAVPVFAEVDASLTIDPADAERKITPYTRAIVPVHMRGAPADMERVMELARGRDLLVLEDAAQAAGARFRGRSVGSIGDAGAFSFQMSKVLTAGEGGALATRDPAVHKRASIYHDSASCPHTGVAIEEWLPGLNLRMSELQAAVLLVQLDRLDEIVAAMRARRDRLAEMVGARLGPRGVELRAPNDPEGDAGTALILFLPEAGGVEEVVSQLQDENVPATRMWSDMRDLPHDNVDLHAYPAWAPILEKRTWSAQGGPWRWHPREVEYPPDAFPVTMDLLSRAVHVDVSPDLEESQVEQMASAIAETVEGRV